MVINIAHCREDHNTGLIQKIMAVSSISLITTPTIYKSFIRKTLVLSGLCPSFLRHIHHYRHAIISVSVMFQCATFYLCHSIQKCIIQ